VVVDRAAWDQRLRRRIPRAAGIVPYLSSSHGARHDRRDRRGGLSADRVAARALQSADEPGKREAPGSLVARDPRARAAARLHSVGGDLSEAVSPAHGAVGPRVDRAAQAFGHHNRRPMRLDPSLYQDLMLSILPELVLTAWSLILLLFVAWRHETIRDLRLAGWLTFAALVST